MNRLLLLLSWALISIGVSAQSVPVGVPVLDDYYRRLQLSGDSTISSSLMIRPVHPVSNATNGSMFTLMPVVWRQNITTDHPVAANNGAMITARGYQTLVSAGFFAQWKFLSVQLMPEFVFAENKFYDGLPTELPDNIWRIYNGVKSAIDLPERFGTEPINKAFWGQSAIRLSYKSLSLGLSNENLWWGPGRYNTLLMTNTAPGFKHITFNTLKPIDTPIGKFEWQVVGGKLEESGYPGVDTTQLRLRKIKPSVKRDDWRYINAMSFNYQPRWLPGLSLGFSRAFTLYSKSITRNYRTYLPLFEPIFKLDVGGDVADTIASDQVASAYVRWVEPKSNYEFYLEFGRADHSWDFTDFALEPGHFRAYVAGFRKLVPLHNKNYLDFHLELTQLGRNLPSSQRTGNSPSVWYVHSEIRHGYTHQGQIIGSGIGPSSNMQSFNLSWNRGIKKLGLEFYRLLHDEDFWVYTVQTTAYGSYSAPWVDLSAALVADWDYKNLLVNFKLQAIASKNYWYVYNASAAQSSWFDKEAVRRNFHAELSLVYLFNKW